MSDIANRQPVSDSPPDYIHYWQCPRCGQTLFTTVGEDVPDMCDYCGDMTTWQCIDLKSYTDAKSNN